MIFGITGSFGSGKSELTRFFREKGFPVFSSDSFCSCLLDSREIAAKAAERWGSGIFASENILDRKKIAAIIFSDEKERKFWEELFHRPLREKLVQLAGEYRDSILFAEIPLLYEAGMEKYCDRVIVVSVSDDVRTARLAARGFAPAEVAARLQSQMPDEEKCKKADFVIFNNGTIALLKQQAELILKQ
ncbi:MAG: dephospho-CoA kinase [Victivallaceae bacterium]|nr:dephospho-CoA kinase [Victivallaceae bacterium]